MQATIVSVAEKKQFKDMILPAVRSSSDSTVEIDLVKDLYPYFKQRMVAQNTNNDALPNARELTIRIKLENGNNPKEWLHEIYNDRLFKHILDNDEPVSNHDKNDVKNILWSYYNLNKYITYGRLYLDPSTDEIIIDRNYEGSFEPFFLDYFPRLEKKFLNGLK